MSFWANYFSPIFQRQRLFCYFVAIVIINATTTTNKKSFLLCLSSMGSNHSPTYSLLWQENVSLQHRLAPSCCFSSCEFLMLSSTQMAERITLCSWWPELRDPPVCCSARKLTLKIIALVALRL